MTTQAHDEIKYIIINILVTVLLLHFLWGMLVASALAIEERKVICLHMAIGTQPIPVRTLLDREELGCVSEGKIADIPPVVHVMAVHAAVRETVIAMRIVVIVLVARDANLVVGCREQRCQVGKLMAGLAGDLIVGSHQRESARCGHVIEVGLPVVHAVAFQARVRETAAGVRVVVIALVARNTILVVGRCE